MNDLSVEEQATRYKQTSEKLQHAKQTVNEKRDEVASIERELAALNDEINRQVEHASFSSALRTCCKRVAHCLWILSNFVANTLQYV